jgi:hypothetical protein
MLCPVVLSPVVLIPVLFPVLSPLLLLCPFPLLLSPSVVAMAEAV